MIGLLNLLIYLLSKATPLFIGNRPVSLSFAIYLRGIGVGIYAGIWGGCLTATIAPLVECLLIEFSSNKTD